MKAQYILSAAVAALSGSAVADIVCFPETVTFTAPAPGATNGTVAPVPGSPGFQGSDAILVPGVCPVPTVGCSVADECQNGDTDNSDVGCTCGYQALCNSVPAAGSTILRTVQTSPTAAKRFAPRQAAELPADVCVNACTDDSDCIAAVLFQDTGLCTLYSVITGVVGQTTSRPILFVKGFFTQRLPTTSSTSSAPTSSPTETASETATGNSTATATNTASSNGTVTATGTNTETNTATQTNVNTETFTNTQTDVNTFTNSDGSVVTNTATNTNTETETFTNTETNTNTATNTDTFVTVPTLTVPTNIIPTVTIPTTTTTTTTPTTTTTTTTTTSTTTTTTTTTTSTLTV